jgi:hypothetical protein
MTRIVLTIELNANSGAGMSQPCSEDDLLALFDAPFMAHIAGLAARSRTIDASEFQLAARMYEACHAISPSSSSERNSKRRTA